MSRDASFPPGWLQRQVAKSVESLDRLPPEIREALSQGRKHQRTRQAANQPVGTDLVADWCAVQAEVFQEFERASGTAVPDDCRDRAIIRWTLNALGDPFVANSAAVLEFVDRMRTVRP